jgi:hypothetical protein
MHQPVFISYRRETGHELANLVASELQKRGYTTFLDIRRPEAGRFWDQDPGCNSQQSCARAYLHERKLPNPEQPNGLGAPRS